MANPMSKVFNLKTVLLALIILSALFLLMAFADIVVMPWYTKHGESLAVPNIIAKRFDAAKDELEARGLEVVMAGEKHDSNLPFGYIVDQNPRANRRVKDGRRVYLTISVGEREIEVPELLSLSETNARERLKSYGLRVGEIEYEYSNELRDVVIAQSHEPLSLIQLNSAVDLVVSLGRPIGKARVPSVLGKTMEMAERDIKKAGLTVGIVTYQIENQLLPNTIINQSPDANLEVPHGTYINLVVTTVGDTGTE
jgi:serine/threonine-protein kinase